MCGIGRRQSISSHRLISLSHLADQPPLQRLGIRVPSRMSRRLRPVVADHLLVAA